MRSSRRAIGAMLALLGLILSVVGVLATTAGASVQDASPESYSGNPSCKSFGYTIEVKIDEQPTEKTYNFDGGISITISNIESPGGRMEFDWSSTNSWSAVLVKQGSGGLIYEFASPVNNDQNVQTVSGANQGGISHVSFCADPGEPSTGSLSVDKAVNGDDPQDPALAFSFTVDCTDGGEPVDLNGEGAGNQASFTLTAAQAAHVLSSIPTGSSCTVTETNAQGADATSMKVDDEQPVAGNTVSGVIIGDDESVVVLATNTFNTERCVPTTQNNQCTPCPPGTSPNGQGGCIPPPPPPPSIVTTPNLSATIACGTGGMSVTISNTGDGSGVVDVLSDDEVVANDLTIAPGQEETVLVAVDEDTAFDIDVPGVASFAGLRDCVEVEPEVITPPAPTPPAPAPEEEVKGVVVARTLPRTGNNALPMAEVGFGLLILGVGLTLTSRRQMRVL